MPKLDLFWPPPPTLPSPCVRSDTNNCRCVCPVTTAAGRWIKRWPRQFLLMPRCLGCVLAWRRAKRNNVRASIFPCEPLSTKSHIKQKLLIKLQNHLKALHSRLILSTTSPYWIDQKRGWEQSQGKRRVGGRLSISPGTTLLPTQIISQSCSGQGKGWPGKYVRQIISTRWTKWSS